MMATEPRKPMNIAYSCGRCGGQYYRDDEGAWICLRCARPAVPVVPLPDLLDEDQGGGRGPRHARERL